AIGQIPALIALLADDARVEALDCGDNDHNRRDWSVGGEPQQCPTVPGAAARACAENTHARREGGGGGEPQQCLTSPAREAARALSRIGTQAIQPLMTALGDVRPTMRRYAAIALRLLDRRSDGPAVKRLVATLGDADWQVRRSVVWALGEVG